jgi:RND superfamily putative drug exporter
MFARLAHAVVKHPWRIVAAWLVAVVVLGAVAPKLADVVNGDQTSFLPSSYESVRADALARHLFPSAANATAALVVKRADGQPLSPADLARTTALAAALQHAGIPHVKAVVAGAAQLAPNHRIQLVRVDFLGQANDTGVQDAVTALRQEIRPLLRGSGLTAGLTGDAAMLVDSAKAYATAETVVSLATIAMILILLGVIFRSPLAALLPVVSVALVYTLATATIALAARVFKFQISQSLTALLIVVLFGIGTDYIVFLLFRYRERLRAGQPPKEALITASARVGEVIASSALAVMVAFGAMLLAVLGDFRAMAPGLIIAVGLMLLAGLTLVPAIISLLGTRVFWPSRSWQRPARGSAFARFGGMVGHRPGRAVLVSAGVLIVLAVGSLAYRANYDTAAELPNGIESTSALNDLTTAFPAGALNPTQVYVSSAHALQPQALRRLAASLRATAGVSTVFPARLTPGGKVAQITLYLSAGPYANAALDAVAGPIRTAAHAALPGTTVLVGGPTSAYVDLRAAINRDLRVIFPVAAVLIAMILLVLLRGLLAPVVLLAAVGLNFAATLGAAVVVFQGIGGTKGLDPSMPVILYLFVVAIGTDYNILMTARLREETQAGRSGPLAAARAIEHSGPTVLAAGAILAGTFASLMLGGISSLQQLGFAVAVGIVLAAGVMATALVPGMAALAGRAFWWPTQSPIGDTVARGPLATRVDRVAGGDGPWERAG